jgi:hypothetical protein
MKPKLWLAGASLAAGVAFASMPAISASNTSLGVLKDIGAAQSSSVTKAHFWHRTCRRGLNGWHKHVKGIGRVQCTNHVCKRGKCYWF